MGLCRLCFEHYPHRHCFCRIVEHVFVYKVSPFVFCHPDYDDLLSRCLSTHDSVIFLSQFKQRPDESYTAYQSFRSDDSGYFSRLPGFPPGHYILFFAVTLSVNGGRFNIHTFCISIQDAKTCARFLFRD